MLDLKTTTLDRFVRVYDHALDPALCARMIESFHALARFHEPNGAGRRAGLEQSRWTELDISELSDASFRAMLLASARDYFDAYVRELELTVQLPAAIRTSEWIIKRYQRGGDDQFQPHFDSIGAVSNRYLVFLWYLNDVHEGGETEFVDLGVRVAPRAGRLVVFPPYWMFQHAGRPPLCNDKYILSTYYLF